MNVTVESPGQLMLAARLAEQASVLEWKLRVKHSCKQVKVRELGWQCIVNSGESYCWQLEIKYSIFTGSRWQHETLTCEACGSDEISQYLTHVFMGLYPDLDVDGALGQDFCDDPQILIENL